MTAVVVVYDVCLTVSAVVVLSPDQQDHPLGAVLPGVIVTVHVPEVPLLNEPANCPPNAVVNEQPETF